MRHFLIDTDTGSDDAVALVMALTNPDIRVEAITVVAGNVPLEQGVQNALYTVELTGANVPVYQGMGTPSCVRTRVLNTSMAAMAWGTSAWTSTEEPRPLSTQPMCCRRPSTATRARSPWSNSGR